jgi:hypothetical protein
MTLRTRIKTTPKLTVKVTDVGLVQTADPIVLKNISGADANRLDNLDDVVEGANPAEKSTLVYNPSTDKYEVKLLDIDGGTF